MRKPETKEKQKPKLLLHICCAPCAAGIIDDLSKDYDVVGYFYNPNIYPKEEYAKRLNALGKLLDKTGFLVVEGDYDAEGWMNAIEGHEKDKEGGERCKLCYQMRLERAAKFGAENGSEFLATTLSMGPMKDARVINKIGKEVAEEHGLKFLEEDFKKNGRDKKALEICKKNELYRQNYCGCKFSMKK
jgi:predicted adenine nucleotide alpha hydrolase (AANH) superfamily ATPase